MQALADRSVLLGEVRGDLVDVNEYTSADLRDIALFELDDSANVYNQPRDYYAVINNCNYYIARADTALKDNRNEKVFMREYAAAKTFRAWTYLQLVLAYGKVPFVTDPILLSGDFGARLSEIGSEGHLRMADFRPCPGGRRGHPFVQRVERGQPFGIRPDQNHVGRLVFVGGTLP